MNLSNRRVVITGGSRGIGAAIADTFADAGADLTILARSADALAGVAQRTGATPLAVDIADATARADAVARIEADGPIDVWINNAGVSTIGPFIESEPDDIATVFAINLEAPVQFCRAVLPAMVERGHGHMVNVSSLSMAVNTPFFATYGASKAGLSSFAESLRVELKGSGVGLTTVEIGQTNTDMLTELRSDEQIDDVFGFYEKLKLQRLIEPSEVADAIRQAVQNDKPFVRLPKRAAAFPALVNLPRTISNALQRGG